MSRAIDWHHHLTRIAPVLPTDYTDYGGEVQRWEIDDAAGYPDCSCGCYWWRPLGEGLGMDWGVCSSPTAPRKGLLTFEHQTGRGCFESPRDRMARIRKEGKT